MTAALEEKIARAICLSKQRHGDTDAVAAQYVDTFWRDYLPEARIAVSVLENGPAGLADAHDNRADADCEGDPAEFVSNKEMILLSAVREAIAALVSGSREDGADA